MMGDMKDSGVDWIGEIPNQWECEPLRYLVEQNGDTASYRSDKPYVALENIESWNGKLTLSDEAGEVESQVGLFKEGDVLFGKLRPYLAKVIAPSFDGQSSTELIAMTPRRLTTRYLYWLLLNVGFINHIDALTYGVKMPRTSWFQLRQQYFPVPERQEQDEISAFLDNATLEIDSKVDVLEKQIDVLERYKKSVIHEAVTKGLDPDTPMKSSGVEWIGDIPEHWEVKRLKYISQFWNGLTYEPEDIDDEGIAVMRSGNIKNGTLDFEDTVFVNMQVPKKAMLHCGDTLICSRNGSRKLIGKNAYIEEGGLAFGAFMMVARPSCNSKYYYYLLNSDLFPYYLPTYLTSTVNQLTNNNFGNMFVPLPPDNEQQEISDYLDEKCAKVDAILDIKRKQIEVLKKRRQSIIYEYVTGKRRVEAGV